MLPSSSPHSFFIAGKYREICLAAINFRIREHLWQDLKGNMVEVEEKSPGLNHIDFVIKVSVPTSSQQDLEDSVAVPSAHERRVKLEVYERHRLIYIPL